MSLENLSKDDIIWAYQMLEVSAKAEVERLTIENAGLRARLKKAVELPCKVGDTVYCIEDNRVVPRKVRGFLIDEKGIWITIFSGRGSCAILYNEAARIYKTSEAAEARLKELRGDKKC